MQECSAGRLTKVQELRIKSVTEGGGEELLMKEESTICKRLAEEGADTAMLEQYRHYEEAGNIYGQYGLVCRFRRKKSEELKEVREKLACLDYLIAKVENADFGQEMEEERGAQGR